MESTVEYAKTPQFIAQQKFLQECADEFLKHSRERKTINILGIGCSSTNLDDEHRRQPSSHRILEETLALAKTMDSTVETKTIILEDLDFDHCQGNYSIQGHYCTWPCWISQTKAKKWIADPLIQLYNDMTDWADIVLIATPIRWWNASSLYYKLVERCNCIENQKEVYGVDLIHNKLMGSIIIGAQDWVQHVMWSIMATRSQMWFAFAKQPFVWYTAWGYTNQRIDLVAEQQTRDDEVIMAMAKEMLENQCIAIKARRLMESI
jgi:multimeric flavodoxin WrbA